MKKNISILLCICFVFMGCSHKESVYIEKLSSFQDYNYEEKIGLNCEQEFVGLDDYIGKCKDMQYLAIVAMEVIIDTNPDVKFFISDDDYKKSYQKYLNGVNNITYEDYLADVNELVENIPTEDDFNYVIKPNYKILSFNEYKEKKEFELETEKLNFIALQKYYKDLLYLE